MFDPCISQLGLANAWPPVRSDRRFHYLVTAELSKGPWEGIMFIAFQIQEGTSKILMHPLKSGVSLQSI